MDFDPDQIQEMLDRMTGSDNPGMRVFVAAHEFADACQEHIHNRKRGDSPVPDDDYEFLLLSGVASMTTLLAIQIVQLHSIMDSVSSIAGREK